MEISSLVTPAVSAAVTVSTSDQSPSATSRSSKRTTPRAPGAFTRVHGSTCFWPVSAIAHHHEPTFGPASHARIAGFSLFESDLYPRSS